MLMAAAKFRNQSKNKEWEVFSASGFETEPDGHRPEPGPSIRNKPARDRTRFTSGLKRRVIQENGGFKASLCPGFVPFGRFAAAEFNVLTRPEGQKSVFKIGFKPKKNVIRDVRVCGLKRQNRGVSVSP